MNPFARVMNVGVIVTGGNGPVLGDILGAPGAGAFEPPPMSSRAGTLCNCGCSDSGSSESPLPPGNGCQGGVEDCYLTC
jgi:hypothetical protein